MIEHKDQQGNKIIFAQDIESATKDYLKTNNALKKDGTPYKTVTLTNTTYSISGGGNLNAKKITKKDSTVFILNDSISVQSCKSVTDLVNLMNTFGKQCIVDINGTKLKSPHAKTSTIIESNNGTSMVFSNDVPSKDLASKFMAWIRKNESGVITPLIEKFLVICRMSRTDTRRFIGYANMEKYLRIIKMNSTFSFNNDHDIITCPGKVTAKIVGFEADNAIVNIEGIDVELAGEKPTPYTIFTTTPTKVGNDTLPFIPIKYRGITIFVSSVVLNNDKFIKSMNGGIDLLK